MDVRIFRAFAMTVNSLFSFLERLHIFVNIYISRQSERSGVMMARKGREGNMQPLCIHW